MNIAIFGGAFDPPHLGHKFVADSLVKQGIVDEVWFVPVFKHPWADRYDKRKLAPYDLRVKMLELMIEGKGDVKGKGDVVSDGAVELAKKQKVAHFKDVSFTYNTLIYFKNKFPEHNFSWVMGSEYLGRFDDFLVGHPKLIDFHFYIYPRAGYGFDVDLMKKNMTFLRDMEEIEVSSTEVKKRIRGGKSVDGLLSAEVKKIIEEKKLYI